MTAENIDARVLRAPPHQRNERKVQKQDHVHKRRVGGYRNIENFKKAIFFYCGELDLYPR